VAGLLALLIMAAAALLIAAIDGKTQETRDGARAALVVVAVAFLAALSNLPKPPQRGLDRDIHASGGA
jgi:peptidoglycan/LPS O-acetylase OafA/YrhL